MVILTLEHASVAGKIELKTLQIIIPLRNPPPVLEKTVSSLVAQDNREFSVLLSDNHSTEGLELIEAAAVALQQAGITVHRARPPFELGRVEHWNWAHHQATVDWVKPIFVGDWLEPGYVAELSAAVIGNPECSMSTVRMSSITGTALSSWLTSRGWGRT